MVFILENDDVTCNSRMPNQWMALFAHSDWLLKFGILFAMLGPSTIENKVYINNTCTLFAV